MGGRKWIARQRLGLRQRVEADPRQKEQIAGAELIGCRWNRPVQQGWELALLPARLSQPWPSRTGLIFHAGGRGIGFNGGNAVIAGGGGGIHFTFAQGFPIRRFQDEIG